MTVFAALWRWLHRLAATIGLLYLAVTVTPLVRWWASALAGPWDDPHGEVLIVLTGSLLDHRTIGLTSYWRAVEAAHVFLDDGFKEMIISGGGTETTPIAVPMRDFVVCLGVPSGAIRLEIASNDTHDSAVLVADLLRRTESPGAKRRLVLLTSDYHMFRSHRAFRKAGVDVLARPVPDVRKRGALWWRRWDTFIDLVEESAKISYYWVRGWI